MRGSSSVAWSFWAWSCQYFASCGPDGASGVAAGGGVAAGAPGPGAAGAGVAGGAAGSAAAAGAGAPSSVACRCAARTASVASAARTAATTASVPEHPARDGEAPLRAGGRRSRGAQGPAGREEGEEGGGAQQVGQDAERAVGVDGEGLHAEQHEVHEETEGEQGRHDARHRVAQVGGGEEREGEQQGEREVEHEPVRGHGQAGEGRPGAPRDVLAAARLAVAAGLVDRRDQEGLAVVLPEEHPGDGRPREAQAQGHHDPRHRARSQEGPPPHRSI